MESFSRLISGTNKYVIYVIIGILVLYIPYMIIYYKKRKSNMKRFLNQNPLAVKVYIPSYGMVIISVNLESPVFFNEGLKQGFMLIPGDCEIEAEYAWTEYGISKNVTTTTGTVRYIVTAEAGKNYNLDYDKDAKKYIFSEKS